MTRINPDDPKWTAYILGELSDSQRAAVEAELETSEQARTLVEELRFAAELTKAELREQAPALPLTQQERETIHAAAGLEKRRWFDARPMAWAAALAAASIAMAITLVPRHARQQHAGVPVQTAQLRADKQQEKQVEQPLRDPHSPTPVDKKETATPPAADVTRTRQIASAAMSHIEAATSPEASGRISGTVNDATAALIPGVTVTATNTQTGSVATVVTDPSGAFALAGLEPGTYRVTAELPGFQTATVTRAQINAGSTDQMTLTMNVAQMAQSVEVSISDAVMSTSSASVGGIAKQSAPPVLTFMPRAAAPPPAIPGAAGGAVPGLPRVFDRIFPRPNVPGEVYSPITDNPFLNVDQNPLSTFSIDVDTASYANVRRFLNQNQLPPHDSVRIEEMINYFPYDYPQPAGGNPIGATLEAAAAPWNPQHRLVRIALKAKDVDVRRRPPSNLVFLLDVSGSMQPPERLPLLKQGIRMMVDQLTSNDRVSVVTYAGTTGVALEPTPGNEKDKILGLIDSLEAGGSTNGGSGIQLAYQQATANFIPNGVNRVILATDGDFNVGITDRNQLVRMIEDKAKTGVFLTVLGVGMGNYKDATLEMLADKGHGNYAYLDTVNEARKVLVDQMSSTFVTVAKDVKAQVEFNPAVVGAYRLIGYEDRGLRPEDFNNDQKDAGDMGAGHTVTALYEVVPRGVSIDLPGVDPLKYQQPAPAPKNASNETLTVKIRYKEPADSDSKLLVFPLIDREQAFNRASADFRFAAAVAAFGMLLRDSPSKGTATLDSTLAIAEDSMGSDRNGYRREFMQLVQRARQIRGR